MIYTTKPSPQKISFHHFSTNGHSSGKNEETGKVVKIAVLKTIVNKKDQNLGPPPLHAITGNKTKHAKLRFTSTTIVDSTIEVRKKKKEKTMNNFSQVCRWGRNLGKKILTIPLVTVNSYNNKRVNNKQLLHLANLYMHKI